MLRYSLNLDCRFREDRLRDGVVVVANETQIARSNGLGRGDADTWGQIGIGAMLGAAPPLIICASLRTTI